jgi:hypothetical protein
MAIISHHRTVPHNISIFPESWICIIYVICHCYSAIETWWHKPARESGV